MSKLSRTPTFGVVISKRPGVCVTVAPGTEQRELNSSDPVPVGTMKSQRNIVNGLFLTRKKTSELFKVLSEAY